METGAQYRFWRGCGFLRFWSVGGEGAAGLISVETGKDLVDFCILGCFGEKRNSWASPVDIEKRGFDWLMVVEYSHDEIGFQVGNEEMDSCVCFWKWTKCRKSRTNLIVDGHSNTSSLSQMS
ncbi:uncharacterized protein LOC112195170 isoform X3 [Rosa chinensis]|nr:uncharacterized protein LOC112195170 isoform X3 [Rosa chinensis]